MALQPSEHFTEFNVAMWSLNFSRFSFNLVTVNRFEQRNKVLLRTAQALLIANTKKR